MITIIIADDEKLIRAGIKKILHDNLGEGFRFIEAKNGKEAYELCLAEKPDLIITDIQMPEMTGVDLMQRVHDLPHHPAMIVLSGYDDFNYARSALTSGAIAYVLKPADTKELLAAVNKALSSVKREEKIKNEETFKSIMNEGLAPDDVKLREGLFPHGMVCVGVCGADCRSLFVPFLSSGRCYVLEEKRDYLSVVIGAEEVQNIQGDSSHVVGVSCVTHTVNDMRKLKREAFSALLQSFFTEQEGAFTAPRVPGVYTFSEANSVQDFSDLDSRYEKLIAAIDLAAADGIKKLIRQLFHFEDIPQPQRAESLRYIYEKIVGGLFTRYPKLSDDDTYLYLKSLMIENIYQVTTLQELVHYVTDYVLYLLELLKTQQSKYPYITKAIVYIGEHYQEDITMATVANYVSMNYTWFSEKFKEQVGINFNEYLRRYRMEQAKRLLEMGTYKIYEVAEKTGFKYVKHFMKSFREMNGMSAGEWQKMHGK